MKISLITVTYNSSRTLRDTIVSVLAQTYQYGAQNETYIED